MDDTAEKIGEAIESIDNLAEQVKHLGVNGAATDFGAIEVLCQTIKQAADTIQTGLFEVSKSIDDLVEVNKETLEEMKEARGA